MFYLYITNATRDHMPLGAIELVRDGGNMLVLIPEHMASGATADWRRGQFRYQRLEPVLFDRKDYDLRDALKTAYLETGSRFF